MGLFSKVKKIFKRVADIVSPIKVVVSVTSRAVATVMRAVAEVEGLVYNAAKSLTEAINFGPSWLKSIASKVTSVVFDAAMMASRFALGVGLLALGALSGNNALKVEGRLELLTAALYFTRLSGSIPQWLLMIVIIVLSFFFPLIMLVVMALMLVGLMFMKWQLPKLADDPDAMLRHLMMLRKYGLLDKETSALLDLYAGRINRPDLQDDTNFGGFEGGYEFQDIILDGYINNIRDILRDRDTEYQGDFRPGNLIVPTAKMDRIDSSGAVTFLLFGILFALARL